MSRRVASAVCLVAALTLPRPSAQADEPARLLRSLAHRPLAYGADALPNDVLLGDLLYHSPRTLGVRAQGMGLSCQTCHPNGAAAGALRLSPPVGGERAGSVDLSTAHFRAGAEDGRADALDIPSLRGVRYTAPYGRDGRTASLAEFVSSVVTSEFDGAILAPARLRALVAYLHELDFLPAPLLDAHGRLTDGAPPAARRGERIFERACASCHVPSSYFRDGRVHRIGSGSPASPIALDDGFETPTLLGLHESAPYFHDGRFATLAEVVAWLDGQLQLHLPAAARADLVAYLDAVGAVAPDHDTRPLARRVVEGTAYLALLLAGEDRDDRAIWRMALEACEVALACEAVLPSVAPRVEAARASLRSLAERASAGPLAPLRVEVVRLRQELPRLAADWTGALR